MIVHMLYKPQVQAVAASAPSLLPPRKLLFQNSPLTFDVSGFDVSCYIDHTILQFGSFFHSRVTDVQNCGSDWDPPW